MPDAPSTPAAPAAGGAAPPPAAPSTAGALATPSTPAAPAGGAPSAPTTETINPGSWMAGMNDDTKAWLTQKGVKDAGVLAEGYRGLEKLMGVPQDRLLKLPESIYDEKGNLTSDGRSVFERLGAPKDGKDYGIVPDAATGDAKRTETFVNLAKDLGLTKAQVQALNKFDAEYIGGMRNASKEAAAERFRVEDAAVKKEWGAAFEQERQIAKEGMIKMGMDAAEVDSLSATLGHKRTMELLNKIGKATGEGKFVNGQRPDPARIPADAKAKISELKADKDFGSRLMNGENDARNLWNRLHKEAYGDSVNL